MTRRPRPVALLALACALALAAPAAVEAAAKTTRVSISSLEAQASLSSQDPVISAGGRFVVFRSNSSNLVPNDTNGVSDVFLRDRRTGLTWRVSVATGGAQANAYSSEGKVSANGRYVVFSSGATNLVQNDTNNRTDIFVRDRKTKTTRRVSVNSSGEQADDASGTPSISGGGRFVVFESSATDLVPNDTNADLDVFVRDRKNKTTRLVSRGVGGAEANEESDVCGGYAPAISADGTFIAFTSYATNLVAGDSNGVQDVFVRNRKTGKTRRASISSAGVQANQGGSSYCSISGGGGSVVYESDSTNLVPHDTNGETDVFVRNWKHRKTSRVNVTSSGAQATDWGGYSGISSNGRFVFFQGPDSNLGANDHNGFDDVYIHDRKTRKTRRVTPGKTGGPSGSGYASISADGRFLAFESDANIIAGDTNGVTDIFVRGPFVWP